jgi:hypothetical protein
VVITVRSGYRGKKSGRRTAVHPPQYYYGGRAVQNWRRYGSMGLKVKAETGLARIFHRQIEQRSGESVRRLEITQPNENATHRFFYDRL